MTGDVQNAKATLLSGASKTIQASKVTGCRGDGSAPLSYHQQGIWLSQQLFPEVGLHNISFAWRIPLALDIGVLKVVFQHLSKRHESLRAVYPVSNARPVQNIISHQLISFTTIDVSSLDQERLNLMLAEHAHRAFELQEDPPMRVVLFTGREQHLLLVTLHSIAADLRAFEILLEELQELYSGHPDWNQKETEQSALTYAEFARWQREWLQGEVLARELSYWKEQLADAPPVLQLPTDYPRPAVQTWAGASESVVVSGKVQEGLQRLGQKEQATLFMVLVAAFQVLLYRYTGEKDLLVGTPVANRNRVELEKLIGFFVNTLVLRTNLGGEPSFRELLRRVREVCVQAYAHQDVPFDKLVEELQPERDLSYTPLFQVMFVLQRGGLPGLKLGAVEGEPVAIETRVAKFDLTLGVEESREGLKGVLEYNRDLFEGESIRRMVRHWQTLLEGIAEDAEQRISELPLLAEWEMRQLLVEWNNNQVEYAREEYVHGMFEKQAGETPEQWAVVFEETRLTYGELNRRANQLAHYLRRLGVGPDVLVAICVERSADIVIGLLGILKAGGVYVPLDPEYPKA